MNLNLDHFQVTIHLGPIQLGHVNIITQRSMDHYSPMPVTIIYLCPKKTIGPRSLIFWSEVDHSDDLLPLQGQGQRSRFRSLPCKIVKTFPVLTKCFHFLLIYTVLYIVVYNKDGYVFRGLVQSNGPLAIS